MVEQLALQFPQIHLITRPSKSGLGSAYIDGFKFAMANGATRCIEIDADLSHDPSDLPRLLAHFGDNFDLVIGSRYVTGSKVLGLSKLRLALSKIGNVYAKLLLGFKVEDSTGGFRCYSADVLRSIGLDTVECEGYGFQVEMTFKAFVKGARISEIPITFYPRRAGASKMSIRIVFEALIRTARLALSKRAYAALDLANMN